MSRIFDSGNNKQGQDLGTRSGSSSKPSRAEDGTGDTNTLIPELVAIHQASQRLMRLQNPEELANDIIQILERWLTYEHLAVLLIHPKSRLLVPFAISDQGEGDAFQERDKDFIEAAGIELGQGITGWVAQHGKSSRVDDVTLDSRYLALRGAIGSELCVPLMLDDRVIGVINVESADTAAYTVSDQQVLETVASQIAIAIENSRLFSVTIEARHNAVIAEHAGEVIHDLGNLLSIINIDASQCLDGAESADQRRQMLERIRAASKEGAGLASRMLYAVRTEDLFEGVDAQSSLSDVVRNSKSLINAIAGHQVRVRTRISSGQLTVRLARSGLEQILLNLVVNACQSMPDGGELIVEVAPGSLTGKAGLGMLRVTDTGVGMSESVRENAFHTYFSTREQGSGLGLAIVARMVAAAGGTADIDSQQGCGTAVTVQLPILEETISRAS